MAECDRSKWKQRTHCYDDLWPNCAASNCEFIITKLCRVLLWNGCLLLFIYFFVVNLRTFRPLSVDQLFLCCYFHFIGKLAVYIFMSPWLVHGGEYVTASFPFISNYSALISHLSVAVVSALSAQRLAWLLCFVCVLTVWGGQLVSGFVWKRVYFGLTDDDDEVI